MQLYFVFSLIIQLFFAVHAGKTGRYWWIFIILFFPIAGSIVYFFVEYLPESQIESKIKKAIKTSPAKNIKQLQRNLNITDSFHNRLDLAKAYAQAGQHQQAIDLLEKCLAGTYANDRHILEGLVICYYHKGNFEKALQYLSTLEESTKEKIPENILLIKTTIFEESGNDTRALEEYEAILKRYSGPETMCRYALLLKKNRQSEKAKNLFEQLTQKAELYPSQYKLQKKWVKIAKKELKNMQ